MVSILGWDWEMLTLRGRGWNCNVGLERVGFDGGCVSGSLIERRECPLQNNQFCFMEMAMEDFHNSMEETVENCVLKVFVAVSEEDLLRDRGLLYCDTLKKSGWSREIEIMEVKGEGHVFHLFKPASDNVVAMLKNIVSFIHGQN